jgi:hypothetical protein
MSLQHYTVSIFRASPAVRMCKVIYNFLFRAASRTQHLNLTCSLISLSFVIHACLQFGHVSAGVVAAVFCGEIEKSSSSHRHLAVGSAVMFSWTIHATDFVSCCRNSVSSCNITYVVQQDTQVLLWLNIYSQYV